MSWLSGIFGDEKKTETTSNQSGSQNYGLTPAITGYAGNVASQYTPANFSATASSLGPNQYQTGAAGGLQAFLPGVTGNATNMWNLSNSGFTPQDIQSFMSPYTSSVVDATRADFDRSNAIARAQGSAQAAKLGALGGTQGIVNRTLGDYSREKAQAPVIAGLYNQGFQQAGQLAAQNAATKISAAGAGNQANNTAISGYGALGQLGSGIQQTTAQQALVPYQLTSQGAQTLAQLTPFSGNNTTGSATGTSTQIATPSLWSIGGDIVGTAMKAASLSDERAKEDIKPIGETFDGQPIYKYRYKGSPRTEIGLIAQDVEQTRPDAVSSHNGLKMVDYDQATRGAERMADGGSVGLTPFNGGGKPDPHERLMKAFTSIRGMLAKANGGSVLKPFADGGDVGMGSWGAEVKPASWMERNGSDVGSSMQGWGKKPGNTGNGGGDDGAGAIARQQQALSGMLGGMSGGAGLRPFAGGGVADRMGTGREIYQYFLDRGLSPHQAAAVAGNMAWEGGGRTDLVNPGDNYKHSPNSPHSIGIGQWNDRAPALVAYARRNGIEIPEGDMRDVNYVRNVAKSIPLKTQLGFAWDEMQGPERRAYEGLVNAGDLKTATGAAIGYHRPAGWTRDNPYNGRGFASRLELADKIMAGGPSAPQPPDGMDAATYGSPSGLRPATGSMTASLPAPYAGDSSSSGGITELIKSFSESGSSSGGGNAGQKSAPQPQDDPAAPLRSQQDSLAKLMASLSTPRTGFARGGDVEWVDGQPQFSSNSDAPMMGAGLASVPASDGMVSQPGASDDFSYRAPSAAAPPLTRRNVIDDSYKPIGKPYEAAPAHSAVNIPTASRDIIPTEQPQDKSWLGKVWDMAREPGVYAGKRPTAWQMFANELQATSSPTMRGPGEGKAAAFAEYAKSQQEQQRIDNLLSQTMAQLTGKLPNGQTTLAAQTLAETQRQHDKPQWGIIGQDQYGVPQYGLIDVNKALPPRSGAPATGGAAPSASEHPATPSAAAAAPPSASVGVVDPKGIVTPGPITQNRGDMGLTGDEYLKTLAPADAKLVKAIAEGREEYPTGMAAQKGRGAFIAAAVNQYDKDFDAGNAAARKKLRANYQGGGKQFQELQAISTVAGHLHDFMEVAKKLDNYENLGVLNGPANALRLAYRKSTQDPAVDDFNVVKQAVTNELSKAYRGGHVTEGDVKEWQANVGAAQSPAQLKTVISRLNGLLMSKRIALEDGYRSGMGKMPLPEQFSSVNDRTRKLFDDVNDWANDIPKPADGASGHGSKPKAEKPETPTNAATANNSPPPQAIKELLSNSTSPAYIESFNKHFNSGKPGLAERMIWDSARRTDTGGTAAPHEPSGEYAPHNLLRRIIGLPPI